MVMTKRTSGGVSSIIAEIELTEDVAQIDFDNLDGAADHGYTLFWDLVPPAGDMLLSIINDIEAADYAGWSNYIGNYTIPMLTYVADTGGSCGQTAFYFDKGTGRVLWRSIGLQIAGDNPYGTWGDTPTMTALRTPLGNLNKITLRFSGGSLLKAGSRFLLKLNKA